MAWRRANGVDDILNTWTPPEVINKYFSFGQFGKDKFGCPGNRLFKNKPITDEYEFFCTIGVVFACAQGRMDMRGILQSVTRKDYMRYQMWMAEKVNKEMREDSLKTGINVKNQMTFIADMEHLSMRQMSYRPGTFNATITTN